MMIRPAGRGPWLIEVFRKILYPYEREIFNMQGDREKNVFKGILDEHSWMMDMIDWTQVTLMLKEINSAGRIFVYGTGRSGLIIRAFGERLMHLGFEFHAIGEISCPPLGRGDLLLVCTGSGTTKPVVAAAKAARDLSVRVGAITAAAPGAPILELADAVVSLKAPETKPEFFPPPLGQPLGSSFEQGAFLLCESMAIDLIQDRAVPAVDIKRRHANVES
ncbi:MAG: SIS domain-containing protein [Treponema sp.]|jgi:6-phospho-3-hexuloisomerase|nr:SIS domain-containing protein [Treponema sp.]